MSMSTNLTIFGVVAIALSIAAYFGKLDMLIGDYKAQMGSFFTVLNGLVAFIGVFFLGFGLLFRQWE